MHSSFSFLQLLGQRQLQLGHLVLPINRRHGQVAARAHVGASVTLIFCRSIDDVALLSLIVTLICIDYSIEKLASVKYIAFGMRARYEKRWDEWAHNAAKRARNSQNCLELKRMWRPAGQTRIKSRTTRPGNPFFCPTPGGCKVAIRHRHRAGK